jgi:hypothetical protein
MSEMSRRAFLTRSAILAAGVVAVDQLELVDRLGWTRRFFPSAPMHLTLWGDGIHDDTQAFGAYRGRQSGLLRARRATDPQRTPGRYLPAAGRLVSLPLSARSGGYRMTWTVTQQRAAPERRSPMTPPSWWANEQGWWTCDFCPAPINPRWKKSEPTPWRAEPAQMVRDLFRVEPDRWQHEALEAFASRIPKKRASRSPRAPARASRPSRRGAAGTSSPATPTRTSTRTAPRLDHRRQPEERALERVRRLARPERLPAARVRDDVERIFSREHPATWFLGARSFAKTADARRRAARSRGSTRRTCCTCSTRRATCRPRSALRRAGPRQLRWGKIVQAGNTTSQTGCLYLAASTQRHLWHLINITADPDDPEPDAARRRRVGARADRALRPREPVGDGVHPRPVPAGRHQHAAHADEVNAALGRGIKADDYQHVQKRLGDRRRALRRRSHGDLPAPGARAFSPVVMRTPT